MRSGELDWWELPNEDLLPVLWRQETAATTDIQAAHFAERNLRVLQACDALEEFGQVEKKKADDDSPHSADTCKYSA